MMKHKSDFFNFFFQILILTAICIIFSFLIVFPTWAFTSYFPKVYSLVLIFAFLCFLIFKLVKSAKIKGISKTLKPIVVFLIIFLGIFLFVQQVLNQNRILGFLFLILSIISSVFISKIFNKFIRNNED